MRHFLSEVCYLKLDMHSNCTLYDTTGYVAFKENIAVVEPTDTTKDFPSSKFTILIFRVKLSNLPPKTFYLSCILYCCYKNMDKSCVNCMSQVFDEIYEYSQLEYPDKNKIFRRSVNCFQRRMHFTSQIK